MNSLTPKEVVSELDNYIIGQQEAKRAVAIALRNRWRRLQLEESLRVEVIPKNILMIGPTGVGKTEIARKLAMIGDAPFIKVEATKFTEVGYVGRDVEQIIRDLVEISVAHVKNKYKEQAQVAAYEIAIDKVVDIVAGEKSSDETRNKFKKKIISGELDDTEIEIQVKEKPKSAPMIDIPGLSSGIGMLSLDNLFGKEKHTNKKVSVKLALTLLTDEASETLVDNTSAEAEAIYNAENRGIVFIDEIDKIVSSYGDHKSGSISREGVQRDLLPVVEGTTVTTKYGMVKTDHILFIASGAFHISSPSDLLPELQGRFPIRVELLPLLENDFKRILLEPKANLIKQYQAMLGVEGITLSFTDEAIDAISSFTAHFNKNIEDIGARRLQTILETVLADINFEAPDLADKKIIVDKALVDDKISVIQNDKDLSKFVI